MFRDAACPCRRGSRTFARRTPSSTALEALRERRPGIRRAVLKLDDSFSGEGNAIFRYPKTSWRGALRDAMADLEFCVPTEPDRYRRKFAEMGGIVEEFLEHPESASPSVQLRIDPQGEVVLLSTHDQILGGSRRARSTRVAGSRRPSRTGGQIQEAAVRVGEVLAAERSREPLRGRLLRRSTIRQSRNGRSSPWRSTCESAGRRIRSWLCSS